MLKRGLLPTKQQLKKLQRGALLRSHGNLGFVTFIPLLLIVITGVILTYPYESRQLLVDNLVDDDFYQDITDQLDTVYGSDQASWERVLERTLTMHPNARLRWVSYPDFTSPYKVIGLQQQEGWNTTGKTILYFEDEMGYMDVNTNALVKPAVERAFDFSYPLHTAKLGLWYRLLITLVGLGMITISVFGLISYFKRLFVNAD